MSNIQIPLFPLNGAIIFPKSNLPLNIFEERYIEMINFSISSNRLIGMIQTDKNDKLYYDGPAMIVWPAGIFHRIISGDEGSISINFSTRTNQFDLKDNFNIYDLCTN